MLTTVTEMTAKALQAHYAVGQFNLNNLEWTRAVLETADRCRSPVILGVTEAACAYMGGKKVVAAMVRAMDEALLTPELASFRKSMKGQLTVLRTEYALALLHEKDPEKAQACLAAFEKAARTSPFPADTETERGLLSLAREAGAQKDAE